MYRRVIVPLDGSPVAEAILPFILEIAGPLDMDVVLLRVVQPIPPQVIEGSPHFVVEDVEARLQEAADYLEPLAVDLRAKAIRVRTVVRRGEPSAEIAAAVHEAGADLVAMTTHGRSGLGRLLFGSVAEAVLRHSEVPVFLMRLTEKQAETRAAGLSR
jgi:nucleotide-binding universal stress UspA family protein